MMIHTKPTNDMMSFLKYKAEVSTKYKPAIKNAANNGLHNIRIDYHNRIVVDVTFNYFKTKYHFKLFKSTFTYYFEIPCNKWDCPNIFDNSDRISNLLYFKLGRVLYKDSKTWYHRV